MPSKDNDLISKLSNDISDSVGNGRGDDLGKISQDFDKTLSNALKSFNSSSFDDAGVIKKLREMDVEDKKDKDIIKNVLNNVRTDYINVEAINQSELLMRRDIYNICTQMPEMHDVIYVTRDSIIECNVATGEVSRSLSFSNDTDNENNETQVKEIEKRHDLLMAIKNFIVPKTLMNGEMYIHVIPYAKLFAELEAVHDSRYNPTRNYNTTASGDTGFRESIPNTIMESFKPEVNLYSEDNVKILTESVGTVYQTDSSNMASIDGNNKATPIPKNLVERDMKSILENINVFNGSSELYSEMGPDGLRDFLVREYKEHHIVKGSTNQFMEYMPTQFNQVDQGMFNNIDQDGIDFSKYSDIKGCYVKYLNSLRMVPIRMDRKVVGYYYVSTTMDLQTNAANPNGIIDLSYQNYTRDKNMVSSLANMIIKSFDKKFLEKNIKLKGEIAEIIMAHKFSEGRLSFIYIPENEIIRLIINEDEDGRGHSMLEPTIFPARMYLLLTLYNMLYTLNNNTTRVHYLKSSGLNTDYAAQIQRTMRKFQQRRITIDDIFSYTGVLNKVGGMGEMVLPAGRSDYKALETDTIAAVENPINIEFLEQQRRQAISGTGVPNLLVINAIDEVDFAKTLEMANTRFLSTVSSYKIDFNGGITKLYQMLMKYETDIDEDVIASFRFQFNAIKQQHLNISVEMIQNFNAMVEFLEAVYFQKKDLEDDNGNYTATRMAFRKELAMEYMPQLDYDRIDEIVKNARLQGGREIMQNKVSNIDIEDSDIQSVEK